MAAARAARRWRSRSRSALPRALPSPACRARLAPSRAARREGAGRGAAGLGGGPLGGRVPVDQRVRELPLRPGELEPVPLERLGAGAALAQLLALADEQAEAERERFDARAGTAPPKARRPQVPQ